MKIYLIAFFAILLLVFAGCQTAPKSDYDDLDFEELDAELETLDEPTEITPDEVEQVELDQPEETEPVLEQEEPATTIDNIKQELGTTARVSESLELTPQEQALPRKVINEGDLLQFPNLAATDPDGDAIEYSYSAPLDQNGEWQTQRGDGGKYIVTITAADSLGNKVDQIVVILVQSVNSAPRLDYIDDIVVNEGEQVLVVPSANDADGDKISYEFSQPLDDNGVWQTEKGDAGTYAAEVTVTDGELSTSTGFRIIVEKKNEPPVLELTKQRIVVNEGDLITIGASASDPDGDKVVITFAGWMTQASYRTDYDDAGNHTVNVTVTDGKLNATGKVEIIVNEVNRAPEFNSGSFD